MQHKCKVTVIEKKLYPDLQEKYLADPKSGACDFYHVEDEFIFKRYGAKDDFWHMGNGTQCSEAWDCISRYVYAALQGGSIMRGWTNDERMMIACCNDGTRSVVFKIERIDYKVLYVDGIDGESSKKAVSDALKAIETVTDVEFYEEESFVEAAMDTDVPNEELSRAVESCGNYRVTKIDE